MINTPRGEFIFPLPLSNEELSFIRLIDSIFFLVILAQSKNDLPIFISTIPFTIKMIRKNHRQHG